MFTATWCNSSNSGATCLEALFDGRRIHIRDSKHGGAGLIGLSSRAWVIFIESTSGGTRCER
ncbi:DUF397 domain-containing protein [Streptomyces sp. NBC_01518]|uniref:DUF397 domain-containing protein n=1 Tax=Streptomyces sp. NBC_01518 TaxID=2903891 RepID=UPI0038645B3F